MYQAGAALQLLSYWHLHWQNA